MTSDAVRSRWVSVLVPLGVGAAVLGVLYALRPGVVENGLRSPRVWLVVLAVLLTGRLVAFGVERLTGRRRLASVGSTAVVAALGIALIAPSFQQRTLEEPFPVAAPASVLPSPAAVTSPSAAPVPAPSVAPSPTSAAPAPEPVPPPAPPPSAAPAAPTQLSSAGLNGVGHDAAGRTSLHSVDGSSVLRFEDVDIEGTPAPYVHLVRKGARTPDGGIALGELKAERGSFSYALPAGVDASAGWTVLVWCRTYATPIAVSDH